MFKIIIDTVEVYELDIDDKYIHLLRNAINNYLESNGNSGQCVLDSGLNGSVKVIKE